MARESDWIENKARLWRIFRSRECYATVERMREFTGQEFLERFCILSDFEADCWKVSERLYKRCGGAYKTVESKLPSYFETLSGILASDQGELQAIMPAALETRLHDLETLPETFSRLNRQVWAGVAEQSREALGAPLRPTWWPELFRKTIWPAFKEVHRKALGKAPKEVSLAEFIENTSLDIVMRHTIESFSDMRFTLAVLKKETSAFLSDLKKAQDFSDDAPLTSLCNRTRYVNGYGRIRTFGKKIMGT